ncbi:MAG: creatininase family protein [Candidatus Latescibacterota bacterium]
MRWENLTVPEFERAVQECRGVGVLAVGVIEPHGSHLPLGTDMLTAHWVACRAAEREPAIVFPAYPWGINHEGAHLPGSVVLRRDLVLALLENVCEEMARQGLGKIVLLSGHGGNRYLLPLFVQTLVEKEVSYCAYFAHLPPCPDAERVLETRETGHACEAETSMVLHQDPRLAKMAEVPPHPFTSLRRNAPLQEVGAYSPVDWYAMYPRMYVGDARPATAEKGQVLLEHQVEAMVRLLRAVKEDRTTPALMREFAAGVRRPRSPWEHTRK